MRFKNLIFKPSMFIILFIVINMGANLFYESFILDKNKNYILEEQYRQTNKEDLKILILGDSHAVKSIDTKILDHSFNFASSGESYIQTYYKLRHILEEDKVECSGVIMPFDLHSFSSFRTNRIRPGYYWKKYINYIELGIQVGQLENLISQRIAAEFAYFDGLLNTVEMVKSRIKPNVETEGMIFNAEQRAESHFKDASILDDGEIEYFLRILELCQKHQISVVLIKYPVTKAYVTESSKYLNVIQYYSSLNDIITESGFPVVILDYQELFINKEQYFADADHLNDDGSIILTQKIRKDLQSLSLID